MTVCLSTNGPSVFHADAPPTKLLVATVTGVDVLERAGAGNPWRVVGHVLDGKHVSALMIEPKHAGIFAGIHNGGLYFSGDDGATWERRSQGITIEHVFSLGYREDGNGV